MPTWSQLGSQNPPNMEPSWLQKPSKRQSSKIIKIFKNNCFLQVNRGFQGSKLEPKSIKNGFKKVLKTRSNFESILDRSWIGFGSILEAKLGPSWHQNRFQSGLETMSKNDQKNDSKKVMRATQPTQVIGGGLPINQPADLPGNSSGPSITPFGH